LLFSKFIVLHVLHYEGMVKSNASKFVFIEMDMHIWIEQKPVMFLNFVQLFLHTCTLTLYTLLSTFTQFRKSIVIELRILMMEPQLSCAQCHQKVCE